jgi:hypothetical protein
MSFGNTHLFNLQAIYMQHHQNYKLKDLAKQRIC